MIPGNADERGLEQARAEFAMRISVSIALLMLLGKSVAYALTGSSAILSDAAESVVHLIATVFSAMSVRFAARPADENHPYGHGKFVVFSIGLEGALIFGAAIFIVIESLKQLFLGRELEELGLGLGIISFLAVTNLLLGIYLKRSGRANNSPILTANGEHVLTDFWTSLAVIAGVAVVWITNMWWLDPIIAMAAAGHIIITGIRIMKRAVSEAMDEAPAEQTSMILAVLEHSVSSGLIEAYHQLRHREVNGDRWIELHLLVPGHLTVREAHERATRIERKLRAAFPKGQTLVTSHIEPSEHEKAHPEGFEPEDPFE